TVNPGQSVTSIVSAVIGLATIIVGSIYVFRLPDTAIEARKLVIVMIIYGILQIFLATAYLIACIKTSIAVYRGVKVNLAFPMKRFVSLINVKRSTSYFLHEWYQILLLSGFYKIIALVSFVEYSDTTSALYCPQLVFYTSLTVFILHIVLVIIRCCCCK
uniref:G_PROTEIN_RECEP_F3_4 domain-containing protein n=1 Tax=Angiostrongylus cantonensis TaxID=6313 RepID=A0A0K0DHK3_ANGCA